jgi:REP element-mobilizing transposase RayT
VCPVELSGVWACTQAVASVSMVMSNYDWDDNEYPLAYLITLRTHGTWLHGDARGAVERHGRNIYGTERIVLDPMFSVKMDENMESDPFPLDGPRRGSVERAIRSVCRMRNYGLSAINVRTNHAHIVASANTNPKTIMNAFKANATRELREAGLAGADEKVWSRGGSTRYLWKPHQLDRAIDYTLYGQGDDLPDF